MELKTSNVLDRVHLDWYEYFDLDELKNILDIISKDNYTPSNGLMFEAFRYCLPRDVKVLILGQDPYPTNAQGLAFSVKNGVNIPGSLVNIFNCLVKFQLIPKIPPTGDLHPWAAQGVLLLNTALTTIYGQSRSHLDIWRPFISKFIRKFCTNNPCMAFLWGVEAKSYADFCVNCKVYGWTHPSPLANNRISADKKFINCPHFTYCNIRWNNYELVTAFTDGACTNNGKINSAASYAAYIIGAQYETIIGGIVEPYEYQFKDINRIEDGIIAKKSEKVRPSNNRGEMLGIINALLALVSCYAVGPIEIISDSELCIKTITVYYPNRLSKGTISELKNLDLIQIAMALIDKLNSRTTVSFIHTRSHTILSANATDSERFIHAGNDKVDKIAVDVLEKQIDRLVEGKMSNIIN